MNKPKKRLPKYYKGMILRHKTGYEIMVVDKDKNALLFDLHTGSFPTGALPKLRMYPDEGKLLWAYSLDTIRAQFVIITNSTAGRLLYGL